MNDIFTVDSTKFLPTVLQNDPSMLAIAQSIQGKLSEISLEIQKNIIYTRIDELDEILLDILAYDLHVDWYDYSYDLDTKRATIKNSVEIHRKMGTKYAVETATSNIFPGTKVEEWFEYDGEPYTFRVLVELGGNSLSAAQQIDLYQKITFYKNARSHFDTLRFLSQAEGTMQITGWVEVGIFATVLPEIGKEVE